jgi:hypothetical protein
MRRQIVGISLVRNEDRFIRQAITNVADFCDRIIILDNSSTDNTPKEIEFLKSTFPHVETHRIRDYRESHAYIAPYADTPTWTLGVDGDEIYDPRRLKQFRSDLLAGKFDRSWTIFGNVVNCVELDLNEGIAKGYPSPPSRSMTKLFNFRALESWDGPCERFHGGKKVFHSGYSESQRLSLHEKISWEQSDLRCLHLCFVRRSSMEKHGPRSRLQPGEKPGWLKWLDLFGMGRYFASKIQTEGSEWKADKYRRGEIASVDTSAFFEPVEK